MSLRLISIACLILLSPAATRAHAASDQQDPPDLQALLRDAETHQTKLDKVREDYTYRENRRIEELDGNGKVKKIETQQLEVFYVTGHQIFRQVQKDGKDLSPDEQKKEQQRVEKEVEKASKTAPGDPIRGDGITIHRLLELIAFRNLRRVTYNGRPTIAVDFIGDPHAKTHGLTEDISKKISGTVWIDDKDHQVTRMEAHFDDNFHVAGGLLATVQKGSNFTFEQSLVNNELWLPTAGDIRFSARVLLMKGVRQNIHIQDDNYQRFHATAVQQPGVTLSTPSTP